MARPEQPELAVGQIWHENDPRQDRNVVIRELSADWVSISTILPDGRGAANRRTHASRERFAGGKYSYVRG